MELYSTVHCNFSHYQVSKNVLERREEYSEMKMFNLNLKKKKSILLKIINYMSYKSIYHFYV